MPRASISPKYSIEQASPTDQYVSDILDDWYELKYYTKILRYSYLRGEENREAHYFCITLALDLWEELSPKVENTPLAKDFSKWIPFIFNSRFFLVKDLENLLFQLKNQIRWALEHLNITKLS